MDETPVVDFKEENKQIIPNEKDITNIDVKETSPIENEEPQDEVMNATNKQHVMEDDKVFNDDNPIESSNYDATKQNNIDSPYKKLIESKDKILQQKEYKYYK